MTTDTIAELEASLTQVSDAMTAPLPDECLLHYLERMLPQFGCTKRRFTERWARGRTVRGRPVLTWASATGGYCDCEVIMNSFSRSSSRRRGLLCPEALTQLETEDGERW